MKRRGWGSEGCERVGLEKRGGIERAGLEGMVGGREGCARVGLEEERGVVGGSERVGLEKEKCEGKVKWG